MKVLNLTQHNATDDQIVHGVRDLNDTEKAQLRSLLTFDELPTRQELIERAEAVASMAQGKADAAMIGGAPFFMPHLEAALKAKGIKPLYAFSKRVVEETTNEAGEVVKTAKFVHLGFVEA